MSRTVKHLLKIMVCGRILEAKSFQKACKVAVGSSVGAKLAARWAWKGQLEPTRAPRWAQEGSRNYLARFTRNASALFGPILGPSWAILGPPWPFSGGPGGHLEADVGLGRLDLGVQGGQKLRCQKPLKTRGNQVFGRFLEATGLQKTCKVAAWRSCCRLEASKTATWMPCWLRVGIKKASYNSKSTKHVPGSLHVGSNLKSDGLENWKLSKNIVKTIVF